MNQTEAELKLMIATIESVEQHLEMMKKAIAYDAACKDESYFHVFDNMISELRGARDKLDKLDWAKQNPLPKCSSGNGLA